MKKKVRETFNAMVGDYHEQSPLKQNSGKVFLDAAVIFLNPQRFGVGDRVRVTVELLERKKQGGKQA